MHDIDSVHPGGQREIRRGCEYIPGFPRRATDLLAAAASGTRLMVGDNPLFGVGSPKIAALRFSSSTASAVGESMTVDVRKRALGGTYGSILTGVFTFAAGTAPGIYDLSSLIDPDDGILAVGDTLEVIRAYVAGGAPTMTETAVFLDYSGETLPA